MKIGIDARFLTHPQVGGFKTYTTNLIAALSRVDKHNDYVLYVDREPTDAVRAMLSDNFSLRVVAGAVPGVGMAWREQVALPGQARRDRLDVFHAPALTAPLSLPCPLVVTLHDTIWKFPERYASRAPASLHRRLLAGYLRFVAERTARRAWLIVTVSEAAKRAIVNDLGIAGRPIVVTHEGPGPGFQPMDSRSVEAARAGFNLPKPYVFALASPDPRKNVDALLEAYARLTPALRERFDLVVLMSHGHLGPAMHERTRQLALGDAVRFISGASDAHLAALYTGATLFAFPSLYEGFGLPPLEAMACGTPVIAADNSSIPEITGDAAELFDAADVTAITNTLGRVLGDDRLRREMAARGRARAATFSWERCARETVAAYQRAGAPYPAD